MKVRCASHEARDEIRLGELPPLEGDLKSQSSDVSTHKYLNIPLESVAQLGYFPSCCRSFCPSYDAQRDTCADTPTNITFCSHHAHSHLERYMYLSIQVNARSHTSALPSNTKNIPS